MHVAEREQVEDAKKSKRHSKWIANRNGVFCAAWRRCSRRFAMVMVHIYIQYIYIHVGSGLGVVSCVDSISLVYSPPFDLRKFYLFECNLYLAVYFFLRFSFSMPYLNQSVSLFHRSLSIDEHAAVYIWDGVRSVFVFLFCSSPNANTFSLRRYDFVMEFFRSFLLSELEQSNTHQYCQSAPPLLIAAPWSERISF